jgi:hypothetical protein
MPGTATQFYPMAGPRVNGYRSVPIVPGSAADGFNGQKERLACGCRECSAWAKAWFSGCVRASLLSKRSDSSRPAEVVGRPIGVAGSPVVGRSAVWMRTAGRGAMEVGSAGLADRARRQPVVRVAGTECRGEQA